MIVMSPYHFVERFSSGMTFTVESRGKSASKMNSQSTKTFFTQNITENIYYPAERFLNVQTYTILAYES